MKKNILLSLFFGTITLCSIKQIIGQSTQIASDENSVISKDSISNPDITHYSKTIIHDENPEKNEVINAEYKKGKLIKLSVNGKDIAEKDFVNYKEYFEVHKATPPTPIVEQKNANSEITQGKRTIDNTNAVVDDFMTYEYKDDNDNIRSEYSFGDLKKLSINGREIAPADFGKYKALLEKKRAESAQTNKENEAIKQKLDAVRQESENIRREAAEVKKESERVRHEIDFIRAEREKLANSKKQNANVNNQQNSDEEKLKAENLKQVSDEWQAVFETEMVKDGILKDINNYSAKMSCQDKEFNVNGKKYAVNVFLKYKKLYEKITHSTFDAQKQIEWSKNQN